jgi:hypothetical protein
MLHIITTCNDCPNVIYLQESDKLINGHCCFKYIIIPKWIGYYQKLFFARDYILNNKLAEDDIICFIDAFDILGFAKSDEIIEKFKKYNTQLLIGAESNCYPQKYISKYKEINSSEDIIARSEIKNGNDTLGYSSFLYVNSGGYIGYKNAVLEMLMWKPDNEIIQISASGTDQCYVHQYFIANCNNLEKVQLDYGQEIFLNLYGVNWQELYFENGRLVNSILKNTPCFVHFHGFAWQLEDGKSVIPLFLNKLKESLDNSNYNKIIDLIDLQQKMKNCIMQVRKG